MPTKKMQDRAQEWARLRERALDLVPDSVAYLDRGNIAKAVKVVRAKAEETPRSQAGPLHQLWGDLGHWIDQLPCSEAP